MSRFTLACAVVLGLAAGRLLSAPLLGGTITNSVVPAGPSRAASALSTQSPVKCPVDTFRELLAMGTADRAQFLAGRSVVSQKLLLAKIKEYQELSPDQRELRLQATELRWYLLPLMSTPPTNRTAELARLPARLQKSVADRLEIWDGLSTNVQQRLLEAAVNHFAQQAAHTQDSRAEIRDRISPARRQMLERGIRQWQEMSEEQREDTVNHFYEFFNLTPQEKSKTLRTISEPERLQIERTVRQFENLTDAQREQCLLSLEKFTTLSLEERHQFLENAQRWTEMTPTERQNWRMLVENLSRRPPIPPGLAALRHSRRTVATNGN